MSRHFPVFVPLAIKVCNAGADVGRRVGTTLVAALSNTVLL